MAKAAYTARPSKQDYFQWLCELVYIDSKKDSYWILAKKLHETNFIWLVPNDDNRASDGIELRKEYFPERSYKDYRRWNDNPCSVFEMLIALARRIDFDVKDPDDRRDFTHRYFWEMLDNLGLMQYDDDHYYERNGPIDCPAILSNFLHREYCSNGEGGLFPLRHRGQDQRYVEIWYQMNAYVNERYNI